MILPLLTLFRRRRRYFTHFDIFRLPLMLPLIAIILALIDIIFIIIIATPIFH